MTRERYVVAAIVIIALMIVAVPFYNAYELRGSSFSLPASSPPFNPQPNNNAFPQDPNGYNVTVLGVIKASQVAPSCSLSNPPCAISPTSIYYVVVNGRNYRLIFQNDTQVPSNVGGTNVVVTGLYITPSTFNADQWTPSIVFFGDIYVYKVTFFLQLPH
jgi:hypothetical protein